jgi:hypothetical protein
MTWNDESESDRASEASNTHPVSELRWSVEELKGWRCWTLTISVFQPKADAAAIARERDGRPRNQSEKSPY